MLILYSKFVIHYNIFILITSKIVIYYLKNQIIMLKYDLHKYNFKNIYNLTTILQFFFLLSKKMFTITNKFSMLFYL